MPGKITLITPPDIFQNNQDSVFLIDLTDEDQELASQWFGQKKLNLAIYFYQGQQNVPWFLHALACSTYKYINLDNVSILSNHLASYVLSKPNTFYSTQDTGVAELYSYINVNRVDTVNNFLERVFCEKK